MSAFLEPDRLAAHRADNERHSRLLVGGVGGLMLIPAWLIGGWGGVLKTVVMVGLVVLLAPRISPEMVMRHRSSCWVSKCSLDSTYRSA